MAQGTAMEIVVSKSDLLKELTATQGVVERKTTIPILSNFLFEASADRLSITATDLDLSLRTACPAQTKKEGSCTIPARKLYDYVKLLGEGDITIKLLENHWVNIRSGRSNTKMVGMARSNFPQSPGVSHGWRRQDPVRRAAADDRQNHFRDFQRGIALYPERRAVAAEAGIDRHGGHRRPPARPHRADQHPSGGLRRVEDAGAEKGHGGAALAAGRRRKRIRRVRQGRHDAVLPHWKPPAHLAPAHRQFPNYEAVLPKDNTRSVAVATGEITAAIQRVAQFADERSGAIRLRLEKNELKISSSSTETGESEDSIEIDYSAEPMTIGFNSQYLIDFFKNADADQVRIEFKDAQSAGQLRPDIPDAEFKYRYVVMPMRI
jgi:DNA polymerase-3 subunit beta